MAHRQTTTIVASNIQNVSEPAFFASVGADVEPQGHDAFLTAIADGYVFETLHRTRRGAAAVRRVPAGHRRAGQPRPPRSTPTRWRSAPRSSSTAPTTSPPRCAPPSATTSCGRRMAADCFSCGTCNTVCPTCYCFDVQDTWNVDQTSGQRTRYWDGCLTEDFAKCSLGEGACENFRDERGRALPPPHDAQGDVPEREARRARRASAAAAARPAARPTSPTRCASSIRSWPREERRDGSPVPLDRSREHLPAPRGHRRAQRAGDSHGDALHAADGRRPAHGVRARPDRRALAASATARSPSASPARPTRKHTFDLVVRSVGRVSGAVSGLEQGRLRVRARPAGQRLRPRRAARAATC